MNHFQKKFIDTFNAAAKNSSRAKLFDNFLTISTAALNRDEKTFATVDDKPLHMKLFAALAGALNDAIGQKILRDNFLGLDLKIPCNESAKPQYKDMLGEIFCDLDLFEQDAGQVFSPQSTANIIGELTLTPALVRDEIQRRGFVSIKEDCCGSGVLILGGLNALLNMNVNPCRFARVFASDIDRRCVQMTFIQLGLYGIPAVVSQRNAATNETFGVVLETPQLIFLEAHHD